MTRTIALALKLALVTGQRVTSAVYIQYRYDKEKREGVGTGAYIDPNLRQITPAKAAMRDDFARDLYSVSSQLAPLKISDAYTDFNAPLTGPSPQTGQCRKREDGSGHGRCET